MTGAAGETTAPADRFARQRLVTGWRQEALQRATVVIAGMGALGNEVAKNLGLAGIGRLVLCDPDTVDVTNLSRTVLFREADVGRPKVEAAAAALAGLAPATALELRPQTLTSGVGLAELRDSTAVAGCLDSRRARLELLGRSALADARLVDGGTGPWSGEVRIRTDPDAGCYACTLSPRERAVADLPTAYTDLYPAGDEAASIGLTAIVGAWMATTLLRLALGQAVEHQLLRIEALAGTTGPVRVARDPDCPHHRPLGAATPVPLSAAATVGELRRLVPAGAEVQTWSAFPISAKCARCVTRTGYHSSERPSEGGRCVTCGAVIRVTQSYRLSDAPASSRLSDLGVAPRELLPTQGPGEAVGLIELEAPR